MNKYIYIQSLRKVTACRHIPVKSGGFFRTSDRLSGECVQWWLINGMLTLGVTNDKFTPCTQIRVIHKGAFKKS